VLGPAGPGDGRGHALVAVLDAGQPVAPVHRAAAGGEAVGEDPLGDVLRQHQGVRVLGGQITERHVQQDPVAVADGEPGHHDAVAAQFAGHADLVEHLEGSGMDDRGP
jgi:hypothetical protein